MNPHTPTTHTIHLPDGTRIIIHRMGNGAVTLESIGQIVSIPYGSVKLLIDILGLGE